MWVPSVCSTYWTVWPCGLWLYLVLQRGTYFTPCLTTQLTMAGGRVLLTAYFTPYVTTHLTSVECALLTMALLTMALLTTPAWGAPALCVVDRNAAPFFGATSVGVHLHCYAGIRVRVS